MKIKRILSALLALALMLSCFAGCGKKDELEELDVSIEPSIDTSATGRYVEQEIQLPECNYARDMVMLSDGRLRVVLEEDNGNILICTKGTQENTWETSTLPTVIMESGNVETVALSPDGTVFCDTIEDLGNETYQPHLWVIDPDGTHRELPLDFPDLDPEKGFFIPYADFTDDGRLMAEVYVTSMHEIDLTTGKFSENLSELEPLLSRIGCAGSNAYILGMQSTSYYHDGETTALPDVLKAQLNTELEETFGNTPRITFWENQDGYLFFTTHTGLYSYIPGGSVTEELVSGSRSTLGDPRCCPVSLTGCDDGSFYLLANVDSEPVLCHFTYDDAAPTAADTELNIYGLYEDEDLLQMISQFQKANPDISVNLEIGLTGEDGVTEADAIRTLNTEILAGNGPDLICLDGFNIDTYLEKGVLADLSVVLSQAGPLLEQVTHCYAEDGKVCAVPTTFAIPAMYGAEHIISQIHDLDSLVAAAKQARAENPEFERIVNGMHPIIMAEQYYDSCSAAWIKEDGTLDAEKLTEFYAAMKELYALDEDFRQKNSEWMAEVEAEITSGEVTTDGFARLFGASSIFCGNTYIPFGTLDGMNMWSWALAGEDEFLGDGYITAPFNGQSSNVFLPRRIMGILTTAAHPQAAENFLTFMLSDEGQSKDLSDGFPVNQVTFDREIEEEGYADSSFGSSDADGNRISYDAQWPDAQQRQELKEWVDNLTIPANTNRTIRYMVMEQLWDCCNGIITPEQAAANALQALNLYLSE